MKDYGEFQHNYYTNVSADGMVMMVLSKISGAVEHYAETSHRECHTIKSGDNIATNYRQHFLEWKCLRIIVRR